MTVGAVPSTEKVLGAFLAHWVREELGRFEAQPEVAPAVLVRSFSANAVASATRELRDLRLSGQSVPVTIVVAGPDPASLVPPDLRMPEDRTLTWYRDHLYSNGSVLVELQSQADSEGLAHLFTIDDERLFSGDSEGRGGRQWLVRHVWESIGCTGAAPQPLLDGFELVLASLRSNGAGLEFDELPPVRRWIDFVIKSVCYLGSEDTTYSAGQAESAIALNLCSLDLFADPDLFNDGSASAVKRQLKLNRNLSMGNRPNGRILIESQAVNLVNQAALRDRAGTHLSESGEKEMRSRLLRVAESDSDARLATQLWEWQQVFASSSNTKQLGDLVRAALEEVDPIRVAEFDGLNVQAGLNAGEREAALAVVGARLDEDDSQALLDILPVAIQKRVEKLLRVTEFSVEPLVTILDALHGLSGSLGSTSKIVLEDRTAPGMGNGSRRLFAFLYGATLSRVLEAIDFGEATKLNIDPDLLALGPMFEDQDSQGGSVDGSPKTDFEDYVARFWSPLRLRIMDGAAVVREFLWDPELAEVVSFGRLLFEGHGPYRLQVSDLEEIESEALGGRSMPASMIEAVGEHLIDDWREVVELQMDQWRLTGIDFESIGAYVLAYEEFLARARTELVPTGAPLAALDNFLNLDTAAIVHSDSEVILGTHPLRIRWFGEKLRFMEGALRRLLLGEFELSGRNEAVFFDSISSFSPYGNPPVMSSGSNRMLSSNREHALHEEYALLEMDGSTQPVGVDRQLVRVMAETSRNYIDEYPHKLDGLAVMLLDGKGDPPFSVALAKELRKINPGLTLDLHICAPEDSLQKVGAHLAEFDLDEPGDDGVFPRFRVVLHRWDGGDDDSGFSALAGQVDIVYAPQVFGASYQVQFKAQTGEDHRTGSFSPLLYRATHSLELDDAQGPGLAAIMAMLPALPDPILEGWSTLSVRRRNDSLIVDGDASKTEFVILKTQFAEREKFFTALHSLAHWVVTIDRHIGRDQIDAVADRPDVIQVREGVGKNQSYTLMVSSSSGRKFVVDRLTRRLVDVLRLMDDEQAARTAAEKLFDVGRNVVPGLMLRALGLGRTSEEIIGLVVARRRIAEIYPVGERGGVEVWISLDDYKHWFGGAHRPRADLLRIFFEQTETGLKIQAQVIESKFRKGDSIGNAEEQVSRTVELVKEMLGSSEELRSPADRPFWVRELVHALQQLPKTPQPAEDLPMVVGYDGRGALSIQRVCEQLVQLQFEVTKVDGVVCATNVESDGADTSEELPSGTVVLRMKRTTLLETIDGVTTRRDLTSYQSRGIEIPEAVSQQDPADDDLGGTSPTNDPEPDRDLGSESVATDLAISGAGEVPPGSVSQSTVEPLSTVPSGVVGMSMDQLRAKYQVVLDTFAAFKVKVEQPDEPTRFQQGPGFYLLRVRPAVGVQTAQLTSRADDLKLRLELPAGREIRTYSDLGNVVIEVPKLPEERYDVVAESLWKRASWPADQLYAPIGEDITGGVVGINFSSSMTPHLLIAGTTGSGKSVALESILAGLCLHQSVDRLHLHLVDPKGTELLRFENSPHLHGGEIALGVFDAIDILEALVLEMEARSNTFRDMRVSDLVSYNARCLPSEVLPWHVVVLDEYADLVGDADERKSIERPLKRLAQRGRAAGIHVIVATQRPSADIIMGVIRSNLPSQLALRVKSAVESRIILDEAGAEALAGHGDALFRTESGICRIQCAISR
jgi:hypothetical protein